MSKISGDINKLFMLNKLTYALLVIALFIGFFLGAQYQQSAFAEEYGFGFNQDQDADDDDRDDDDDDQDEDEEDDDDDDNGGDKRRRRSN